MILIVALSCFVQFAKAQIVYTDVNPDQTFNSNTSYNLDLNNDGTIDFTLTTGAYSTLPSGCQGYACLCHNTGANVSIYPLSDSVAINGGALDMNLNDTIGGSLPYSNHQPSLTLRAGSGNCTSFSSYSGNWTAPGYLGLKLIADGQIYYGWVHLSVSVGHGGYNYCYASFTLMDYAYNSIPDQLILAGQTCSKKPKATITPSGIVSMCAGSITTLSANSGNNHSYQWKKNGSNISGATNSALIVTESGKYKVTITNTNTGCSKTSKVTTVNITCKAGQVLNNEKLSVSPNPFSQTTVISFELVKDENVSIRIFDVEGRLIRTLASGALNAGVYALTWDSRDNPHGSGGNAMDEGIYFLQLQSSDFSQTEKLMVTK